MYTCAMRLREVKYLVLQTKSDNVETNLNGTMRNEPWRRYMHLSAWRLLRWWLCESDNASEFGLPTRLPDQPPTSDFDRLYWLAATVDSGSSKTIILLPTDLGCAQTCRAAWSFSLFQTLRRLELRACHFSVRHVMPILIGCYFDLCWQTLCLASWGCVERPWQCLPQRGH